MKLDREAHKRIDALSDRMQSHLEKINDNYYDLYNKTYNINEFLKKLNIETSKISELDERVNKLIKLFDLLLDQFNLEVSETPASKHKVYLKSKGSI